MQPPPLEQIRITNLYTSGNKTYVTYWIEPLKREEVKKHSVLQTDKMMRLVTGIVYMIISWIASQFAMYQT